MCTRMEILGVSGGVMGLTESDRDGIEVEVDLTELIID